MKPTMRKFYVRELRLAYENLRPGFGMALPQVGETIEIHEAESRDKPQLVQVTKVDAAKNCFSCETITKDA